MSVEAGRAGSAWRAMAGNPLRFLASWWPWRALAYLVTGVLVQALWVAAVAILVPAGVLLTPVLAGIALLVCVPLTAVAFAAVERWRLRWMDRRAAPTPHREPDRTGVWPWLRFRLAEQVTWREFGYALLAAVLAAVDAVALVMLTAAAAISMAAPILVAGGEQLQYGPDITVDTGAEAWAVAMGGAVLLVVLLYAFTALAAARAALARALLVRPAADQRELEQRLVEVRASRARLADAFEAERRRIERDLHDGAQQRLTGLIMTLGLAKIDGGTPELIDKARSDAQAALAELRDLVRGIHPAILTDRGLGAAVQALAEGLPVPVEVAAELPVRPPEPIETAAYFVIAEALANVAKHSAATRARVSAEMRGPALVVEVRDDGAGGADPAGGTGLQGLADRVAVYDGTLRLSSPPGGPTLLRVEMPCES